MKHDAAAQISLLRRHRALAERYLALVAKEQGMHPTDTSALSHLMDQSRNGTVLSAGELGELLALSGPATTAAIDRLERQGLVERRQSASDGRRVEIHLTEGVEVATGKSIFTDMGESIRGALGKNSSADVQAFTKVLGDICDAMAELNQQRSGKG